eukprot:TRINITY_DN2850_c0_g1_i1.p1 TRINITY_DN2850_c0_g1~~TRINITY_DN2850_c0_g1_i1.p1  ORF type:complete len:453 (-),score=149.62 TRINITY_DN2850_c0_g1_i1:268-1626(-)
MFGSKKKTSEGKGSSSDDKSKDKEKKSGTKIPFLSKRKNTTSTNPNLNPPPQNDGASALSNAIDKMKINQAEDKRDPKDKVDKKSKKSKDEKDATPATEQMFDRVVIKANNMTFLADKVVGNGSFGTVVRATIQGTNEVVAIKKVLQDKRYKNRELQIMQMVSHPCIVELKTSFYSNGDTADEVYLNLVLEYIPDTVYRVSRQYSKSKTSMPMLLVKLYTYQLLRSLGYIHSLGICHRDIKPQNLLLDPNSGILKLCDFGSAKALVQGEPNVSYICSRYYRAPELIFGATNYTTSIDIWSAGCVVAELLMGHPLFPGDSGVDQLVEIIKILGAPTKEEMYAMNPSCTDHKFPPIKGHPWSKVFSRSSSDTPETRIPPEAIDIISKLLQYTPTGRVLPYEGLSHPFFDELRANGTVLPNGQPLPQVLFNFSEHEIKHIGQPLLSKILPDSMKS